MSLHEYKLSSLKDKIRDQAELQAVVEEEEKEAEEVEVSKKKKGRRLNK